MYNLQFVNCEETKIITTYYKDCEPQEKINDDTNSATTNKRTLYLSQR